MIRVLGNYNPESFVQHQTVLIVWYLRWPRQFNLATPQAAKSRPLTCHFCHNPTQTVHH